jgi:hypothetical protein
MMGIATPPNEMKLLTVLNLFGSEKFKPFLKRMSSEKILSSLPLQILLYFNEYYTWLWFFMNLMIFCWKS